MTASFADHLSSKEKVLAMAILLSLISWITPHMSMASAGTDQEKGLTFEIQNQNFPKNQTEIENEKIKVELVREYLEQRNSPLANYTDILLAQEDWKMILALSNAESSLGKRCYHNNCSGIYGRYGIGYAGLKKYETKAQWIVDLQSLLDRRYEGWSLDKMNGIYVYPRSASWYRATTQVFNDLTQIEKQFPTNNI